MRRLLFLFLILFGGCTVWSPLQKGKFISVFHLIETAKYDEAKVILEEMILDEEYSAWARTWYVRGVLAQTAYREGMEKNDRKKYELYPEQLYVIFDSFEKAMSLDHSHRLEKQLAPKYILLANDLQKQGERHFNGRRYPDAYKAFEHAWQISQMTMLSVRLDTNLLYNTALSAYESELWEEASRHFDMLHTFRHSVNVTHLLSDALIRQGKSVAAERVLREGIADYEDQQDLVLLLADLLVSNKDYKGALKSLDAAISADPSNAVFHRTKGLIQQKNGEYLEAILSYSEAVRLDPGETATYVNIATCYYNLGVEIEEQARTITNNSMVQMEKEKSAAAFDSAVIWLDKAFEKEPGKQAVIEEINQLYKLLRIPEK